MQEYAVRPKTIQIFLPDGNPRSIKVAHITSRTVQAMLIPRAKLEFACSREELDNVGIYFLVGEDEEQSKPSVYIGEAECLKDRLRQHNKSKDFWQTAIAIISKTQFFTKAHVKFLEGYCYEQTKEAGRFALENGSCPAKAYLNESDQADLMDNFDTIKALVSTLGFPFFDEIVKKNTTKADIIYCEGKGVKAKGEYTEDGLVVFKGSTCTLEESKGFRDAPKRTREKLIEKGILEPDGKICVFKDDYVFNSPSQAASLILANSSNGWQKWKYKNGKTLDEALRQE